MMRQYELVERVRSYDPSADEVALNKAYVFSMQAHGTQKRASGDPYFSHPVEVAGILSEKKLDAASIITGLLHDTVEDTVATLPDIQGRFGDEIARLVDGVTKLSQLELQSGSTKQAENFRKLVLAMSEDIRVLIVKIADRLHNMRTLSFIKSSEKRHRIAMETMEIYVPLAQRIGIRDWQNELEDLAFGELNFDARESIIKRLDFLHKESGDVIGRIIDSLRRNLSSISIEADVHGREKRPHSIWRKMRRNSVGFEQLSDTMAFRIVVKSVEDCYRVLWCVHSNYPLVTGRFKDYISLPKQNGYQSLHTDVIGPENQRIEIQIRTTEMHDVAELGVAAHWQYKEGVKLDRKTEGRQYRWLRELLEILENAGGPEEFLEHTRMEMFPDQLFCFSPKGEVQVLPKGATPIDFAYAVHTDVGNNCVGAKINGRMMPLRTQLRNGDQVEILTSNSQVPSPGWASFVVTAKARSSIRRFVRIQRNDEYCRLGREIVQKVFMQEGYEYSDTALSNLLLEFKSDSLDDLFTRVGQGEIAGHDVLMVVFPGIKTDRTLLLDKGKSIARAGEFSVEITGFAPGMEVGFAKCCHPLPGDRIIGILTTGKGISIHTLDCEALEIFTEMPERWMEVGWAGDGTKLAKFIGRIRIVLANEPGALGTLSTVIGRDGGNISNLRVIDRSPDFFELIIDVEVSDSNHMSDIIAALRATSAVRDVERAGH
ncbi:MAG: bifunctional (p)ppGpp synthetase/guanosine-3',5'-bis(diphosphate) 3'-pyrophosphohydrolase [Rhodospirillaceae bacterium]|nr:bifunctional (p)ppGpp synthetase/guanosine-3',5'-bis(diphosphate) 3'-pyrophosphohydrolase [Rhodospirillaceae bacterium]